jgi:hypothetical protein
VTVARVRFDIGSLTVLYMFDPNELRYETPDPFGTDRVVAEFAEKRATTIQDTVLKRATTHRPRRSTRSATPHASSSTTPSATRSTTS